VQPLSSSQHFMEPEGSLPSSQELSTCTYPEPDQSSPQHSHKILTSRILLQVYFQHILIRLISVIGLLVPDSAVI
jgi:hypothetical protein